MTRLAWLLAAGLCLTTLSGCMPRNTERPAPGETVLRAPIPIGALIRSRRWVCYCPTAFRPGTGDGWFDGQSVEDDLRVLATRFDGLITYSATDGMERVPAIARSLGFKAFVVGVWDPRSESELRNVERLAAAGLVQAVCIGNEGLGDRYRWDHVMEAARRLRSGASLPVATSEPIHGYGDPRLGRDMDFLLPNIHPFWENLVEPEEAAQWVERVSGWLRNAFPDKPLLVKETGYPSAGGGRCSEEQQAAFWRILRQKARASGTVYAAFEAFDLVWKHERTDSGDPGPHWGWWTNQRTPKRVVGGMLGSDENSAERLPR